MSSPVAKFTTHRWYTQSRLLVPVLQGVVGVVLLSAALMKLAEGVSSVHAAILLLGVLSPEWSARAAVALPLFELLIAVWLITGIRPRAALLVAAVLLALFTAALIGLGTRLGWRHDCGCNALLVPTSIGLAIVRNAVLLLLVAWAARLLRSGPRVPPLRPMSMPAAE